VARYDRMCAASQATSLDIVLGVRMPAMSFRFSWPEAAAWAIHMVRSPDPAMTIARTIRTAKGVSICTIVRSRPSSRSLSGFRRHRSMRRRLVP
jgi:hypothetical protein